MNSDNMAEVYSDEIEDALSLLDALEEFLKKKLNKEDFKIAKENIKQIKKDIKLNEGY
jgi:hypothetical protein